ncbi:MAG TPA: tetratricopeptide repeat protein [Steroidobacteraceae bacterium]|jgi:tetratricopeptide (TPR) repeat protein
MKPQTIPFVWLLASAFASIGCIGLARSEPPPDNQSNKVLGANAALSDGAAALMRGNWQRGIELTQRGMAEVLAPEDRAAALANLCAGYAALKQFAKAIGFCDQSLQIDTRNWRAWQNRAACNLGLGKIEDSLQDIQRGLQLNPDSDALQKTLAMARDYERQRRERLQHLLES